MTRTLRHNDELCEPGRETARWRVVDPRSIDGYIKLFDRDNHVEEYKLMSDINAGIIDGKYILLRKNAPKINVPAQDDTKLDEAIQRAMGHVRLIEKIQRKHGISLAGAYKMAMRESSIDTEDAMPLPSRASIYRYAKAKRNDMPPLMGDGNKGNRLPRYKSDIVDLVCWAANSFYLVQESRWTLVDLGKYVNDRARESGWLASGQSVSQDYIRNVIYKNESVDPEIERMDPKLLAAAKSIAKTRILTTFPFERVEQDALHLPYVAMTPHGPTSNIYWIHAIDCALGMPVGWNMVIGAPAESDGLKCVESILFPKKPLLEALGLSYEFDIHGTPHQLIFDNGPETRGQRMDKLVRLDIDCMHCKSRHAHGKPYIERLNRSLKEALQTLPGCTRLNGKDGMRDPVALGDPLMTVDELEKWIVRWYFEEWANSPLKRHMRTDFHELVKLGNTPFTRWKTMTEELAYVMPLSPSMSDWLMTLYEHHKRTLNRKTGITYDKFNYRGGNLKYLIKRYGEVELNILINPDDYRVIYVNEGDGLPLVPLTEEFVEETTPGYSFKQMAEGLSELKDGLTESPIKLQFRKEVYEKAIASTAKTAPKKQSKAEANRAVADKAKKAKAINRAITNPIKVQNNNTSGDISQSTPVSFADAPALPILNRISGEEQP